MVSARHSPALPAVDQVRDYISRENLGEGARLPSERGLADELGIGRALVRAAYRELENRGILKSTSPRIRVLCGSAGRPHQLVSDSITVMTNIRSFSASSSTSGNQEMASYVGIAHGIQEAGYTMMTVFPDALGNDLIDRMLRARPRGFIGIGGVTQTTAGILFLERLHAAGLPVAILGDNIEHGALSLLQLDIVCTDQRRGARAVVEHLHRKGCERIAFQRPLESMARSTPHWHVERHEGYLGACEALGLEARYAPMPDRPRRKDPAERFEAAVASTVEVLREVVTGPGKADAIMLPSDGAFAATAAACRRLGRKPGRDIALVGYDNYWARADERAFEAGTPTATVDKRDDLVGEALVRLIEQRAGGEASEEPQRVTVKSELIDVEEQHRAIAS